MKKLTKRHKRKQFEKITKKKNEFDEDDRCFRSGVDDGPAVSGHGQRTRKRQQMVVSVNNILHLTSFLCSLLLLCKLKFHSTPFSSPIVFDRPAICRRIDRFTPLSSSSFTGWLLLLLF